MLHNLTRNLPELGKHYGISPSIPHRVPVFGEGLRQPVEPMGPFGGFAGVAFGSFETYIGRSMKFLRFYRVVFNIRNP